MTAPYAHAAEPNFQAEFQITRFTTSNPKRLSKAFRMEGDTLIKESGGNMKAGTAERLTLTLSNFVALLPSLTPKQATAYGISAHPAACVVVAEAVATAGNGGLPVVARTRDYFQWPAGAGLLMLDYDAPATGDPLDRDALRAALAAVCPALADAPAVWRPSASSCIWKKGGAELRGIRGQRLYIPVMDASDITRAGKVLFDRLWLAGHGCYEVSKSGSLLQRSLIDASVFQPERLDFCGGASCGKGLEQRLPVPIIFNPDAAYLDTRAALPDLTADEVIQLEALRTATAIPLADEQQRVKEAWVIRRVSERLAAMPEPAQAAARPKLEAAYRQAVNGGWLGKDFELTVKAKGSKTVNRVTVGDLLAQKTKYHEATCLDPMEPDYPEGEARFVGWVNLAHKPPYITSRAHGGTRYYLGVAPAAPKPKPEPEPTNEDTGDDMPGWFADGPDGPITPEFDKHHPRLMRKFGTTQLLKNHYNAVEIAENAYPGLIGYNEFRQRIEKRFDPPWGGGVGQWTDRDTAELACKLSKPFAAFSPNVLGYAVMTVAYRHPFNPAQDRLRALADQWDGESRIDGWLVKYLGAQVNASNADYLREISAAWIKGVAARVLDPGCKRDDVLVLCGKQGVGKSTAAQHLSDAIQPDSFTDNLGDLSSKDSRSGIRGIIIAELGELAALGKSDIESIKTFVATRSDHFREAYGKGERDYPRTVSFIGTTNNPTFLIDPTGNRRWWPVTIGGPINIPRFAAVIPQLLGEAAARVLKGERWHVTDEAATEQADNVRAAHFDEDIWTPRIKSAVADLMAPGSTLDGANTAYVCIPDILNVIGVRIEQQNKVAKNRVGSVLRQMKFTEHRNRKPDGDRFRTWYPPFCPATPDDDGSCGPVAGQKEASQTAGKPVSPASPATISLNKLNQLVEGCGRDDDSPHGEDDTDKIDCFSSHIGKVAAHAAHAGLASQTAASEPGHNWDATISSAELRPPPVDTIDIALARAATAKPQSRKDLARIAGYPKLPDLDQRIGRLLAAGCLAPLSGGLVAGGAA